MIGIMAGGVDAGAAILITDDGLRQQHRLIDQRGSADMLCLVAGALLPIADGLLAAETRFQEILRDL
jgi:hypothetical protein